MRNRSFDTLLHSLGKALLAAQAACRNRHAENVQACIDAGGGRPVRVELPATEAQTETCLELLPWQLRPLQCLQIGSLDFGFEGELRVLPPAAEQPMRLALRLHRRKPRPWTRHCLIKVAFRGAASPIGAVDVDGHRLKQWHVADGSELRPEECGGA